MKKIFLTIIILLVTASSAFPGNIESFYNVSSVTIGAGRSWPSPYIDFSKYSLDGIHSVDIIVTGDGTARVQYRLCNKKGVPTNDDFILPTTATDVVTAMTKTSGDASDGRDHLQFSPEFGKYFQFYVTETLSVNSVTITIRHTVE